MKKLSFITVMLLLASGFSSIAQIVKSSDAEMIKEKKMIVAYRPYSKKSTDWQKELTDSLNAKLEYVMKNYWSFSEVVDCMTLDEAEDYIKDNKDACYITVGVGMSSSTSRARGIRYISKAEHLQIYAPSLEAGVYLPYYHNHAKTSTLVYGVLQLQKMLELLNDKEFNTSLGMIGYVKRNGPKLLKKTLLIPEEFVNPNISADDIKLLYPFDLELVEYEKIERAITERDPKYAVVYFTVIPAAGKLFNKLYVSNAEDGDIYGLIDGNKMAIDLGFITLGTGRNKKYLINKKELKNLGKLVD